MKSLLNFSRYNIYDDGRIFDNKLNKFINYQLNNDGYCKVTLRSDSNKRKTMSIHRLIAILYVPNPDNKSEVNHKDGNKLNNNKDNLEWVTHAENIKHAWCVGLIQNTLQRINKIKKANKGRFGKLNKKSIPVRCIETKEEFESYELAGKHYNICGTGISANIKGKQLSAGKHKILGIPLHWEIIKE